LSDGNKYKGDCKYDKRNGHGVFTGANGNKYNGEWKDDNRHGHGITATHMTASGKMTTGTATVWLLWPMATLTTASSRTVCILWPLVTITMVNG
jgi:hypothetical protein